MALTAKEILEAVAAARHPEVEGEWLNIAEFTVAGRRLDMLAFRLWGETPYAYGAKGRELKAVGLTTRFHRRHVYEIKVSRADLRAELRWPEKRAPGMEISHQFSFAVPAGLMKRHEVPEDCGLVEVREDGKVRTVKAAPTRMPTRAFTMDEVGRMLRAQHLGPDVAEWRERARVAEAHVRILTETIDRIERGSLHATDASSSVPARHN